MLGGRVAPFPDGVNIYILTPRWVTEAAMGGPTDPEVLASPRTAPVYGVRAVDPPREGCQGGLAEGTDDGGDTEVSLIRIRVLGNGMIGLVMSGKRRPPIVLVMSPRRARQLASEMLLLADAEPVLDGCIRGERA